MPIEVKTFPGTTLVQIPPRDLDPQLIQLHPGRPFATTPKTRHSGWVTWFDTHHGYGFLACGHEIDVFADTPSIEWQSRHLLKSGDWVDFNIMDSEVGPKARLVKRNHPGPASAYGTASQCNDFVPVGSAPVPMLAPAEKPLRTILLIESDDAVRAARGEFLGAAGYFVALCPDPQLAREIYKSILPIDLMVVGLCPGKPLARYIQELNFLSPQIPVMLSSEAVTLDLWRETQLRDWRFLPAASSMPLLLTAVRSLLRPYRLDAA